MKAGLALAIVLLAAPLVSAQAERGLTITARDDGHATSRNDRPMWFESSAGRNPPLRLEPGAEYRIRVLNEGRVNHTLRFGDPIDAATAIIAPNGTELLRFRAPESGAGAYWCELHDVLGMGGPFAVGAEPPRDAKFPMQRSDLVPGFDWILPVLAAILAAWRLRR